MKILAPAKINLALDILSKDKSGYHEIQTIFQEYPALSDELEILEIDEPDNVEILNQELFHPISPEDNLAYEAIQLLKERLEISQNILIRITKKIPIASGLGGASSDAATTLKALNKLWDLNLSTEELTELAAELGMDVPYFILCGTALGTHFGEKVTPLKPIKGLKLTVLPESSTNTKKTATAYSSLDLSTCGKNTAKTEAMLEAIERGDNAAIIENLHNDFGKNLCGSGPSKFKILQKI
jgi:4-diphosphocytidyl-2-C-methyl-D-erythritol kinase